MKLKTFSVILLMLFVLSCDTGDYKPQLNVYVFGNGEVVKDIADQESYDIGTVINLEPIASEGWALSSWTLNGNSESHQIDTSTYELTIDSYTYFRVHFEEVEDLISVDYIVKETVGVQESFVEFTIYNESMETLSVTNVSLGNTTSLINEDVTEVISPGENKTIIYQTSSDVGDEYYTGDCTISYTFRDNNYTVTGEYAE